MFRFIVLISAIAFSFGAYCADEPTSSLKLISHIYSLLVDAPAKKARVAGTIIELNYVKKLNPTLEVLVNGGVRLEGGSSRALYDDEFAPRQTPLLRESSVNWTPVSQCNLAVGSLNQNFLSSPLIAKDQSFPGLRESCVLPVGQFKIRADLEQTYATDTQFTHPTGRSLQSDAQFFIERVTLGYEPSNDLSFGVHASHYLFSGLSSLVAYQSQFMGNTSSGLDENNADFRYSYQPYEYGANALKKFDKVSFELRAAGIHNSSAPAGANSAYEVELKSKFKTSENLIWEPGLRYFYLESDATPSFFNDPSAAHANSRGLGAQASFAIPQSKAEVVLMYSMSKPIATTLYQPGTQSWAFAVLRLNYDLL